MCEALEKFALELQNAEINGFAIMKFDNLRVVGHHWWQKFALELQNAEIKDGIPYGSKSTLNNERNCIGGPLILEHAVNLLVFFASATHHKG